MEHAERLERLDARHLDRVMLDRERLSRPGSFVKFIPKGFAEVRPEEFVDGWHIGAIAEHLEALYYGQIMRLLINIPPGCMKSMLCCILFNSWIWTHDPTLQFMTASYSAAFSRRDALRTRKLIMSPWYQDRWGDNVQKSNSEEWSATKFCLEQGGWRFSTSVHGGATGDHSHIQAVDDPMKATDASGSAGKNKTAMDFVWDWWTDTMPTRLFPGGRRLITMQRLHEADLGGRILEDAGDGEKYDYDHLCIPMEHNPKLMVETSIGWTDPREEKGQLLWPEYKNAEDVAVLRKELGSMAAAAQLDQSPSPMGGAIFKRPWFRYWYKVGFEHLDSPTCIPVPPMFDQEIQSWDMTFKDSKTSDYVAGTVWGKKLASSFLLDLMWDRMDAADTVKAVLAMSARHPRTYGKIVEDAANGPAVVSMLKKELSGLVLVGTGGGKVARANAVSPIIEAGNVYLPHPEMPGYEWVEDFLGEVTRFPVARHDDRVDSMTHALVRLHLGEAEQYVQAMQRIKGMGVRRG